MREHTRHAGLSDTAVRGRRKFLATTGLLPMLAAFPRAALAAASGDEARRRPRFFFTSQGKTALVNADGSGLRYFQFDKPGQATWQPGRSSPTAVGFFF